MKTSRRGFLRFVMGVLASMTGGRLLAQAATASLEIHTGTRNTLLGALGRKLPRLRRAPSPIKLYPGKKRLTLPPVSVRQTLPLTDMMTRYVPAEGFASAEVSLRDISRLLFFTNGTTGSLQLSGGAGQIDLRAAPSAGALYAGEVYLVAVRVAGILPGVYNYSVKNHELILVQQGLDHKTLLAAFENRDTIANAAVFVVITNVFQRYQWTYANRGYRYALIDTGHIGENLRLAAASMGWGERRPARFQDDIINELLVIDGRNEATCAMHALGPLTNSEALQARSVVAFAEKQQLRPTDIAPGLSLTQRYHEATKLVPGALSTTAETFVGRLESSTSGDVILPEAQGWPSMSVEQSIRERRSPLVFRAGAIALDQLAVVLELAQQPRAYARTTGVDLYIMVYAVEGLEQGLYRYLPLRRRLALVRRGDLRRPMVRICLGQKNAGSAAVACLMVGRLTEATVRGRHRRYRDLLIESGEIGQRIYLAAESLALAARNLAAFRDDALNALLGLNGQDLAVVHLTMLGYGA